MSEKKMHLKKLSAYFVCCTYLITLLTNVSVEANSVDPDQTTLLLQEQFDLDQHCLTKRLLIIIIIIDFI